MKDLQTVTVMVSLIVQTQYFVEMEHITQLVLMDLQVLQMMKRVMMGTMVPVMDVVRLVR